MKTKNIVVLAVLLSGLIGGSWFFLRDRSSSLSARPGKTEADSFTEKITELANSEKSGTPKKVEFRESEVDAYLQHEISPLFPKGLKQLDVKLGQDSISAKSLIDFDAIETSDGAKNPLMSALFHGEHNLDVVTTIKTQNGTGTYQVSHVLLDQKEVPKPLVDLLIRKYVIPKYPAANPDSPFELPYNIKKVDLLPGKAIVHQNTP